ncbi:MAG: UDP-glucose/GDP-mannose dehydrogenase family protein [Sphingomonadales bacterium]|nr:UDP-glucose/GDP-mannose dehydrogenase family protein [Sphingomonadales bacterium]
MKICMIGAGYVGLVSAACFSKLGWCVECVDKDCDRVERLIKGEIPIFEPGLDDIVSDTAEAGRLTFVTDIATAMKGADLVFLAVGTPMRRGDGHADLSYIFAAVDDIAPHLEGFTVITTKSTVPVGTSRRIEERLRRLRPDADFAVCSNPEFLREGSAIQDFMHPDRILIGCDDPRAEDVMKRLYAPLALGDVPVLVSARESAELAKYAANAFLAMKISFINQIADLCEQVGADIHEVADAIGRDKRIGENFLQPGPGYGGSCFPKDVAAIIRTARENRAPLSLIETVQHINEERKIEMARRIRSALNGSLAGKTIGVLGITFKANTDDIREAPALTILPILVGEGASVRAYDPQGRSHAEGILDVTWCNSAASVADRADAVIVLTEWSEFRALDLRDLRKRMKGRSLLDFRNVFRALDAEAAGLTYVGIGRTSNQPVVTSRSARRKNSAAPASSLHGAVHLHTT